MARLATKAREAPRPAGGEVTVYDGKRAVGVIVRQGRLFHASLTGGEPVGVFADRGAAMHAILEADRSAKRAA